MLQVWALVFLKGYRPLVFHLPFWAGIAFGVVMQLSSSPCCKASMNIAGFKIGNGTYNTLLGFNVVSTVVCWGLAAMALLDNRGGKNLEGVEDDSGFEAGVAGKAVGVDGAPGSNSVGLLGLPVPAFLRGKGASKPAAASSKDVSSSGRGVATEAAGKDPQAAAPAGASAEAAGAAAGEGAVGTHTQG